MVGGRDRLARLVAMVVPALGCAAPGDDVGEGGSSGGGEVQIDASQFSVDACGEGSLAVADSIVPAQAVDFLELATVVYGPDEIDGPLWPKRGVIDATGTQCAGAADGEACSNAFAELSRESELVWSSGEETIYFSVAYTRGDEVGAFGSVEPLTAFLAPVDSPGDAALLVRAQDFWLDCEAELQVGTHVDGFVVRAATGSGCGPGEDREQHVVLVRPDGSLEILQTILIQATDETCTAGRVPAGLCAERRAVRTAHPVGALFSEMARLEAASVPAFSQLARELVAHGAPRPLVDAALRSRRDEIRHARAVASLARRYGARPTAPRVQPTPTRTLVDMAADNAAEGCVRETFGALVAHAQARRAADPVVRRTMARIAHDEARHAALSWDIARWAHDRLGPDDRRRVDTHAGRTAEALRVAVTRPCDETLHRIAGLPRAAASRRALEAVVRELVA